MKYLSKVGSAASEEKSFENVNGRTDAQMDVGRKVITTAHPQHSSGELKRTPNPILWPLLTPRHAPRAKLLHHYILLFITFDLICIMTTFVQNEFWTLWGHTP